MTELLDISPRLNSRQEVAVRSLEQWLTGWILWKSCERGRQTVRGCSGGRGHLAGLRSISQFYMSSQKTFPTQMDSKTVYIRLCAIISGLRGSAGKAKAEPSWQDEVCLILFQWDGNSSVQHQHSILGCEVTQ